jgi:hypothetical protein
MVRGEASREDEHFGPPSQILAKPGCFVNKKIFFGTQQKGLVFRYAFSQSNGGLKTVC